MIRFIDLTGQVFDINKPKEKQSHLIAYYDTTIDRFIEIGGEQSFCSFSDMENFMFLTDKQIDNYFMKRMRDVTPKEFMK